MLGLRTAEPSRNAASTGTTKAPNLTCNFLAGPATYIGSHWTERHCGGDRSGSCSWTIAVDDTVNSSFAVATEPWLAVLSKVVNGA